MSQSKAAENLDDLSASKTADLAETLRVILEELEFDRLNQELQRRLFGRDYSRVPYPFFSRPDRIQFDHFAILRALELGVRGLGVKLTQRQKYGLEFFMFTETLGKDQLDALFGEERCRRIDDFLEAGLFLRTTDHRVRMNGLSVLSTRVGRGTDEKAIYILADSQYHIGSEENKLERVYVGPDSYELVNKQPELDWLSGTGIDMGSGSGIQLIAALKTSPELRRMIGFEKDRRAVNVSKFNAYVNDVGDRVAIVENESELNAAIEPDGNQTDFAITNPPFLPVPDSIEIDPDDMQTLSRAKGFRIVDMESTPKMALREMWPMSGWGGADGLSALRPMLKILFPIIKPSGRIIGFGQFAGNSNGPTKIIDFVKNVGGWEIGWEPLTPYRYPIDGTWNVMQTSSTAESMANWVIQRIIGGYPELTQLIRPEFVMKYASKILNIYRSLGITRFYIGFLNLRKVG
jgi:hypothetical protein